MRNDDAKRPEGGERRPEEQDSGLASTREDSTLAEQVLDDSPHPGVRADKARELENEESKGRS